MPFCASSVVMLTGTIQQAGKLRSDGTGQKTRRRRELVMEANLRNAGAIQPHLPFANVCARRDFGV